MLDIYSVTTAHIISISISIPVLIKGKDREKSVETLALINCGAGGLFIDQNYAKNFEVQKLDEPLIARNIDGTENKKGRISSFVDLKLEING